MAHWLYIPFLVSLLSHHSSSNLQPIALRYRPAGDVFSITIFVTSRLPFLHVPFLTCFMYGLVCFFFLLFQMMTMVSSHIYTSLKYTVPNTVELFSRSAYLGRFGKSRRFPH